MKKKLRLILFAVLLIINGSLSNAQQLPTERLTIADGLSNSRVDVVFQDSYGLLWICTNDGLNLYDGYSIKVFKNIPGNSKSIANNEIYSITEDSDKNIWLGTDFGISRFIRERNEFENYDMRNLEDNTGPLSGRSLAIFADSKNNIWAGVMGAKILKFNSNENKWEKQKFILNDSSKVIQTDIVMAFAEDENRKLWGSSFEYGLLWYDESDEGFRQVEYADAENLTDFTKMINGITAMYADITGVIWITTRNGIYKYNPETKNLKTIQEYAKNQFSFWNYYNGIISDKSGNIWITNNFRGILKFDGISDDFEKISLSGQNFNKDGTSDVSYTRIIKDRTGIIWIGTVTKGLIKYDPDKGSFTHYKHDEKNKNSLTGNQIFNIIESKKNNGKILIGTRGSGLNSFNPVNKKFSGIPISFFKDGFNGSIHSLLENDDGSLWVGTWGEGLIKLNSQYNVTKQFSVDLGNSNSLSGNSVRVLKKDADNNLWIGTTKGLNFLDPNTNEIKRLSRYYAVYPQKLIELIREKAKSNSAKVEIVKVGDYEDISKKFSIIKPRDFLVVSMGEGRIRDSLHYDYGWIEKQNGELVWSSKDVTKSFYTGGASKNRITIEVVKLVPGNYKLRYISDDSHSFGQWNEDAPADQNMWGISLFKIENVSETNFVKNYIDEPKKQAYINSFDIRSIHISEDGIVWVGTKNEGLNKFDFKKNKNTTYSFDENKKNWLSDNDVQFIYEDKSGMLWLATNGGLNKFDPVKETFTVYTEDDGLPTNYISSILPGENNDLWISSGNGISRMVTDESTGKVTFVNYNESDGLGGSSFSQLVALKSSSGKFYFGGDHGLTEFMPTNYNTTPPKLIFTDLKLSNKSVHSMKDDSPIDSSLFEIKTLTLPYTQNNLSFEFAALHYANPQKNQYAHRLKGYEEDWIYDNSRIATYTNLDPGEYVFEFKGTNRDGIWNDQSKSLSVIINPPWWRTTLAYVFYGIVFVVGIFGVDRFQRRRLLSKTKERLKIKDAEHRAEAAELQAKATEAERRALEAEYDQKKKELDEARELQLSMLPEDLPNLPNLDIAVYMQTATEVGGDYYDFHVGMDGTLTVVVGDATGHGMKAGTMVTATKSLFNILAPNPDILATFSEITRVIKGMKFNQLSMCLMLLKIKGNELSVSSAAMPPALIYRKKNRAIEEIFMKGMPLGSMKDFPYTVKESHLEQGDTVLLLSDGLPELTNGSSEMYGYDRTKTEFHSVGEKEPEEIVEHLKHSASQWINGKAPDDDVTFVVLKMK